MRDYLEVKTLMSCSSGKKVYYVVVLLYKVVFFNPYSAANDMRLSQYQQRQRPCVRLPLRY